MLFNIVPVLVILTAAAVALVIFARRLPEIAAMNVDTIPEEKAAHAKRRLLAEQLERKSRVALAAFWQGTASARAAVVKTAARVSRDLRALEQRYRTAARAARLVSPASPAAPPPAPAIDPVAALLAAAAVARRESRYSDAERDYLEAIKLDSRNADAYGGLGLLYRDQGMYEEARQALEYAVKLHERAETYAALGEVARASHDYRRAAEAYEQAVALEPLNHGYLDHLVDVCILGGRNAAAAAAFEKFRAAGGAEARLQALSARLKPSPRRRTTRPTRPL